MKLLKSVLILCLMVLSLSAAIADPSYIYGFHDNGGEYLMANKNARGWIVFTEEIGSDPNNYSGRDYSSWANAGYGVIVRLNNGYGSAGTLPYESSYDNFAARCKNYVNASSGVAYWIIGNETNLPREWPGNNNGDPNTGQPITVARYVSCYNKCYTQIKSVKPGAMLCPSPSGTWAPPYPGQGIEGFVDYWVNCLNSIGASKIDGLALHAYTHGCDPSLVTSNQLMGPPYETIYYHFRVYRNYMSRMPAGFTSKPVMITECDENVECAGGDGRTWSNTNSGWVRNIYSEINSWNGANAQKIRCVALFRWTDTYEGQYNFGISPRSGVIDDFNQALDYRYTWGSAPTTGTITGNVKNSGGSNLSGASVTAGSYSATTDANGNYTMSNVNAGTYTVTASKSGYNSSSNGGVVVTGGQTTTSNFTLSLTPTGTNILRNAVTYLECGHNNTDQRAKYICDGNTSTKWCCLHNGISSAGDHWIAFDLGSNATVTSFVVKHASTGGEATYLNTKTYYIESASSLMGPWTQEFYVDNSASAATTTSTYGTPKTLRYIRLRVTQPNPAADWAVRIPEFEVYGTAGSSQPVQIEAENYDRFYGAVDGTEYHDVDAGNSGTAYRNQNVDIESCSEGTYNVGWTNAGEWLIYPWQATTTTYTPTIRYAGTAAGTVRIYVDGVDKTGAISLPSTGGWQTWTTKSVSAITVSTGWHDIKLSIESAGFNINYFTLAPGGTPPPSGISQDFESMPSWSSSFDATWGSAASWSISSGGQSGNFLQASRSGQGSSAKVLVYNVSANTNYTVSVYIKCPNYTGGAYWVETACKAGNNSASDFDGNAGTWSMIQKFANDGVNGNGNVWTQYSTTINTGSNTQISIGFKHGASGCTGPTVGWDTLRL